MRWRTAAVLLLLGLAVTTVGACSGDDDDTSLGLTVGVSGDFEVTRWLSVVAELSGHWADLESNQFFGLGHAGLAVRF